MATTTSQSALLPVLRGDGVGPIDFGTPTDEALDQLEQLLGPPDSTSERFFVYFTWDRHEFTAAFDEYPFYRDDGEQHLVGWSVWGEPEVHLTTEGGIRIGSTYAELVAAHGDSVGDVVANEECMPPWYVWLDVPSSEMERRMLVAFDGDPVTGGRINSLSAGASEGC